MNPPKVFISHSHKDDLITQNLVTELKRAGAHVWVDIADITHGDFMTRINAGLAECEWVILVQTPDSIASQAVNLEINAAINLTLYNQIRGVIPFIARPCERSVIPPTWRTLHYYDATQNYTTALSGLLTALGLPVISTQSSSAKQSSTSDQVPPPISTPPRSQTTDNTGQVSNAPNSDLDDAQGFSDFFEAIFGRTGTRTQAPPRTENRRVGENIEQPVEISLREAYEGTSRIFTIQSPTTCTTCRGTGELRGRPCPLCDGTGYAMTTKRIQVSIPKGADNGTRVRVAGEGQPETGGGPRGDLYLVISVKPDPYFEREGDDLYVTASITKLFNRNGGDIRINLPDEKATMFYIPANRKNGEILPLAGRGFPKLKASGNGTLFVKINIT